MPRTGRPTKYKGEETIEAVYDYLDECEDEYKQYAIKDHEGRLIFEDKEAGKVMTRTHLNVGIPSIEGFADFIDVSIRTVRYWKGEHEDFLHALEDIKKKQKQMLEKGGLSGLYNSNIAKLMLHNHGYSEKKDVEHSGGLSLTELHDYEPDDE